MAQTIAELSVELEAARGDVKAILDRLQNIEHAVYGNGKEGLTYAVPNLRRDIEGLQQRHRDEDENMRRDTERIQANHDAFRIEFWAGVAVQLAGSLAGMGGMAWVLLRHLAPLLAIVTLAGCTRIVAPGWSYTSVAQQKSLGLQFDPDGGITRLDYNTASDPAVEALAAIAAKAGTP